MRRSACSAASCYARIPASHAAADEKPAAALGPSRGIVYKLAALFSIDAFAGGFAVQSLVALWLFNKFGLSLSPAGLFFFWTGVLVGLLVSRSRPGSRRASGSSTRWCSRTSRRACA